jgi:tetratricopeptide (TPR) repeat protein
VLKERQGGEIPECGAGGNGAREGGTEYTHNRQGDPKETAYHFARDHASVELEEDLSAGSDNYRRGVDASNDNLRKIIPNLLITSLEQSGYFQVTTWSRMQDLLKQMGRKEAEFIDPDLGFELCRLDSIDAIVIGSVGKAGEMYATEVQVLDVETKELYRSANARGMGLESILGSQIDQLSKDISQGLGISRRISEAKQLRVSDVTTSSLEAYDLYLQGKEAFLRFNYPEARSLLEKAVELDPTFAIGHLWLGFSYSALAMRDSRQEAYNLAFEHQERAMERDRLLIQYQYAVYEEEDEEKGYEILLEMKEKYPRSGAAHSLLGGYYEGKQQWEKAIEEYLVLLDLDTSNGFAANNLGYLYLIIGENEKALDMFNRYAAILPDGPNPLDSIAETYFRMGRIEDSISKYRAALEVKPDFGSGIPLSYLHALKEEYAEALDSIEHFIDKAPSPGIAVFGYAWKAFYCSMLGRFGEAFDIMEETFSKSDSSGNESPVFELHWVKAWLAYERGDLELSRNYFTTYAEFMTRRSPSLQAYHAASLSWHLGRIDLKAGEIDSARSRFEELSDIFPEMQEAASAAAEMRMTHDRDIFEAELLLAEGQPQRALEICKKAAPLDIPIHNSRGVLATYNLPSERDTLARAYVKMGELDSAIREYEKLITFDPGSQERRLIHPRSHYRLAKLYEQTGKNDKALQHYLKFLDLWKDADPGLPEVADARERVAGLKGN